MKYVLAVEAGIALIVITYSFIANLTSYWYVSFRFWVSWCWFWKEIVSQAKQLAITPFQFFLWSLLIQKIDIDKENPFNSALSFSSGSYIPVITTLLKIDLWPVDEYLQFMSLKSFVAVSTLDIFLFNTNQLISTVIILYLKHEVVRLFSTKI